MTGSGSDGDGGRGEQEGRGLPIRDGWEAWGARGLWTARAERTPRRAGASADTRPDDAGAPAAADREEDDREDTGRSGTGRSGTGRSGTGRSDTGHSDTGRTPEPVPRAGDAAHAPASRGLPRAWGVAREVEGEGENFGAGRLVRLYTLTGGRTRAREELPDLDLIAQISATENALAPLGGADAAAADPAVHTPEHERLLHLVRRQPLSVAELAAECDLPVGVVRILLGDLLAAELVRVDRPVTPDRIPDERILREVINGLRAL
jgi:hypothetical protein